MVHLTQRGDVNRVNFDGIIFGDAKAIVEFRPVTWLGMQGIAGIASKHQFLLLESRSESSRCCA